MQVFPDMSSNHHMGSFLKYEPMYKILLYSAGRSWETVAGGSGCTCACTCTFTCSCIHAQTADMQPCRVIGTAAAARWHAAAGLYEQASLYRGRDSVCVHACGRGLCGVDGCVRGGSACRC